MLAKPNSFMKDRRRRSALDEPDESVPGRGPRRAFLSRVLPVVKPSLLAAGYPNLNVMASGSYLWVKWPTDLFIAQASSGYLHLRVNRTNASVNLHINAFETREGNQAALDVLREQYGVNLEQTLEPATIIDWHAGQGPDSDRVSATRNSEGYEGGDAQRIGEWLAATAIAWLNLLRANPIPDLAARVEDRLARGGSARIDVGN
jgi:hypothetical protein